MISPEQVLIEAFSENGIEAWSSLDEIDNLDEIIFINRNDVSIDYQSVGMDWRGFSYDIDLQCYIKGSQEDAEAFGFRVLSILDDIYYKDFRVDLSVYSMGWLPPLNDKSGTSLGIQITITQGV